MKPQELRNLSEAYSEVYQDITEAKLPGDDLFNQMFRGNKKVKGLKTQQPGQNRYLAKQNQKRSAQRYAADMGRSRVPSYDSYDEQVDIYDIILSHLLDEEYAETVESAQAIMVNMSEEWREEIIEAASNQSDKQIDKGVKTTYKAQNVLDNVHQGRSRGINRLPANERNPKIERMRGRLKDRRDDLFGERNKREDAKRAQLKKMLGL